ncbi:MAG: immunity 26/phosphotriesterase HocA family protein [Bacteroidetes bacterium]|nr:immunity 26/phosphotriesterase HocA family protein [Bacteroidota bacterium]
MKKAKKNTYKAGDIFAIQIENGQYVFGRILLDIPRQCIEPNLVADDNPLRMMKCLVLEGYNLLKDEPVFEDAPVIINGYLAYDSAFVDGVFKIVGHKAVNPKEVEFPGYFDINLFGEVTFERGEISIPLNISEDEADSFELFGGIHFSEAFDTVILTLMGRTDLVQEKAELKYSDIRFNSAEKQEQIYNIVGKEMSLPYYELALRKGIYTARFFGENSTNTTPLEVKSGKSRLLENTMWTFNGEEYKSIELFEKSLKDYNEQFGNEFSNKKTDLSEIIILLEYIDEKGRDKELKFNVKPDNGEYFTEVELLYKINNKVTKKLADLDKHFFEGLSLLQKAEKEKPTLYALNLGS